VVAAVTDIDEPLEGARQARPHRAGIVRAIRDGAHLEAVAVVLLEQPGREVRGGVLVVVPREVSDANTVMPVTRALRERRKMGRDLLRDVALGTQALLLR